MISVQTKEEGGAPMKDMLLAPSIVHEKQNSARRVIYQSVVFPKNKKDLECKNY